jgi:hypothetical protein
LPFYLFASLGSGVLFYGVGTAAGVGFACSAERAGNLCGPAGFSDRGRCWRRWRLPARRCGGCASHGALPIRVRRQSKNVN